MELVMPMGGISMENEQMVILMTLTFSMANEEQHTVHGSRRSTNRSSQEVHPGVVIEDIFVGSSFQLLGSES